MRCAETTFFSYEIFNSSRILQACCIVSQSEVLPIITETNGSTSFAPFFLYFSNSLPTCQNNIRIINSFLMLSFVFIAVSAD
ncbi:hypothetical protein RU97_GL000118 [Enterococcus canis]|uniref:Uncharacterized protein n=1 Tax=Enterococcus canis TaxID=214095 RepID=A0A1L8RJK4_9ENTE|nr:hypothetical protein RU97_GL000118 [Enterococcus canis]